MDSNKHDINLETNDMGLVTIHTYNEKNPAMLAQMRLEAEGINAYIHSSEMNSVANLLNSLEEVRLQVQYENKELAEDIISNFNTEIGI